MINPYTGFYDQNYNLNPTQEQAPQKLNTYHGDMGAGILFFSDKLYGGFAVRNLLTANESFYVTPKSSTPFRMTAHLGSNFNVKHPRNYRYNIFVSPNVLIANQGKDIQANAGIMAGVSLIYFGSWFRYAFNNPDALIFVAGIRKGKVRFGYSYDVTVSRLSGRTGGSHELTLVFNWSGSDDNSLHPHIDKNYIECPEILNF
jgi:type IX secretion system PorP/SprF family membrane protein